MGIFSKPLKLPYSCYDVGHTWCPSCTEAALQVAVGSFYESLKIYGLVYIVSTLMQRKRPGSELFRQILQSSAFLSFNAFSFLGFFCMSRAAFGGLTTLSSSYVPALLASFLSIFIEKTSRRKMLALYVTNVALETALIMLSDRGWLVPDQRSYFWTFFFSCIVTVGMQMHKTGILPAGLLFQLFSRTKGNGLHGFGEETVPSSTSGGALPPSSSRHGRSRRFDDVLFLLSYCLKGFVKPFAALSLGSAIFRLIFFRGPRNVSKSVPRKLKEVLTNPATYSIGLFSGSFTALYRMAASLLFLSNSTSQWNDAIAGFCAGFALALYPSTSIIFYVLLRVLEGLVDLGIKRGKLPVVPGSVPVLYAMSTALLLHAGVLEPHNLKPSYWKFLNRLTRGLVGQMNRRLMDPLGFKSSLLNPEFWPRYDGRFVSSALSAYLKSGGADPSS